MNEVVYVKMRHEKDELKNLQKRGAALKDSAGRVGELAGAGWHCDRRRGERKRGLERHQRRRAAAEQARQRQHSRTRTNVCGRHDEAGWDARQAWLPVR
ncbi:MAG: hypothetical protein LBH58_05710 [Tannerellaceae bacterium]|nr:hypothetical protein [Tannerellaceae bacterium]